MLFYKKIHVLVNISSSFHIIYAIFLFFPFNFFFFFLSISDELKGYFEKYGRVQDVEIIFDKYTHKSRGFAFLTFEDESVAQHVLSLKKVVANDHTVIIYIFFKTKQNFPHILKFCFFNSISF